MCQDIHVNILGVVKMSEEERQSLGKIVEEFTRDIGLNLTQASSELVGGTVIDPQKTEVSAVSNAVEMIESKSNSR